MGENCVEIEFRCFYLLILVCNYLNLNLAFVILPIKGVSFMVHLFLNVVNVTYKGALFFKNLV